jgi:hypothetical protein
MQDEVPYPDGVLGEPGADHLPVLLHQDGHGDHQSASGAVEYARRAVPHGSSPGTP